MKWWSSKGFEWSSWPTDTCMQTKVNVAEVLVLFESTQILGISMTSIFVNYLSLTIYFLMMWLWWDGWDLLIFLIRYFDWRCGYGGLIEICIFLIRYFDWRYSYGGMVEIIFRLTMQLWWNGWDLYFLNQIFRLQRP